jgi:pyridoxamine 5'-phosphate oxidase family protein
MFSPEELAFLASQRLARLGTVATDGQPDVDAVGFQFDGARFYVVGRRLEATRKYKNIAAGNAKVSLIIDDLETVQPWRPRGIKLHGRAELIERGGRASIAITPVVSWSWGLGGEQFREGKFTPHKIVWSEE